MTEAQVSKLNTLTNIFVCLSHTQFNEIVLSQPLQDFPLHCYFMRDCPQFEDSMKDVDRLGGSFTFIEKELAGELVNFKKLPLTLAQQKVFRFARLLVNMFEGGMLDHARNLQGILEKLYIRQRALEDIIDSPQSLREKEEIVKEMHELLHSMPSLRLIFLSPSGRAAFHRFSAWMLSLVNALDDQNHVVSRGTKNLVLILPEIFIDTPFELFRIFKRSNLSLNAVQEDGQ